MSLNRRTVRTLPGSARRRVQGSARSDAARFANSLSKELQLFALTFAGGFLFMSVYLA